MPKEMLTVVDKPLIQYAVEECLASGIEHLIFVTGRRKSAIEDHFDLAPELEHFLEEKGKDKDAQMVREIDRLNNLMVLLTIAIAGGPFIGLLGTVWGVMETFSGIARANSASLTAMAPGVAGALIATVTGLLVAIPAMFAYNFMVTTIRAITQELDGFATRYATQIEHVYVDNRDIEDKIAGAIQRAEQNRNAAAFVVA